MFTDFCKIVDGIITISDVVRKTISRQQEKLHEMRAVNCGLEANGKVPAWLEGTTTWELLRRLSAHTFQRLKHRNWNLVRLEDPQWLRIF